VQSSPHIPLHWSYSQQVSLNTVCYQNTQRHAQQERYLHSNVCIYIYRPICNNPCTGLDRPWGFQEAEAPRYQSNRYIKVAMLSTLRTGRFYPQEIFLTLIIITGWVDPSAGGRIMTSSGIETGAFRLVAQCLNTTAPRRASTLTTF